MQAKILAEKIKNLGISVVTGIPDSALKPFCDYMNQSGQEIFSHYVPANEGAAVGIAIGSYLATGKPACIYTQNSGIGNMVNPVTSLANEQVYGIPMLCLVGWRGEPGTKDEPQHKFMGNITLELLNVLKIEYAVLSKEISLQEIDEAFSSAEMTLRAGRQFAFIITRDFFEQEKRGFYDNKNQIVREEAIQEIVTFMQKDDLAVSTTGKISRELYEQSNLIKGDHKQSFLTVGGMGHASMIAFGIAKANSDKRVLCLDGDGAVLMHMGSLAFLGKQKPDNLVHICLNNEAHESVGGMPTGSVGLRYAKVAEDCGYPTSYTVDTLEELRDVLARIRKEKKLTFLEIKVSLGSRSDLGRPKETAADNKDAFMQCVTL